MKHVNHRVMLWIALFVLAATAFSIHFTLRTHGDLPIGETWDAGVFIIHADRTESLLHVFMVTNTTSRAVRILRKDCSCTCTDTTLAETLLKPGQSTNLTMSVKLPVGPVFWRVQCVLHTNAMSQPDWTYAAQFKAVPRIIMDPSTLNFGILSPHEPQPSPLTCTLDRYENLNSSNEKPLAIRTLSHPPDLSIAPEGGVQTDFPYPGVRRSRLRLKVGLSDEIVSGDRYDMLGSRSRNIEIATVDNLKASALVSWRLKSPVSCSPAVVHFGTITHEQILADDVISKSIFVSATPNTSLTLKQVAPTEKYADAIHAEWIDTTSDTPAKVIVHLRTGKLQSLIQPFMSGDLKIDARVHDNNYIFAIPWSALYIIESTTPSAPQPSSNDTKGASLQLPPRPHSRASAPREGGLVAWRAAPSD